MAETTNNGAGRVVLIVLAALIAGFLISQIIRRYRRTTAISNLLNNGTNTIVSTNTITNTNTSTNTSTTTSTGTINPNSEQRIGCTTPLVTQGRMYCEGNKKLTYQSNGQYLCC